MAERRPKKSKSSDNGFDQSKMQTNQEFIKDREIIDPIVMAKVQPAPNKQEKEILIKNLKISQKKWEYRCHPWLSDELRSQIQELDSQDKSAQKSNSNKKSVAASKQENSDDEMQQSDQKEEVKQKSIKDPKQNGSQQQNNTKEVCGADCSIF